MARNECCEVGVLPLAERIGFPGVRELIGIRTVVAVKGASVRVIPGYVLVERRGVALFGGGARALVLT